MAYLFDARHRNIAVTNLKVSLELTDEDAKRLSLKVFENLGKIIFEMAWSFHLDKKRLIRHFHIEGISHIQKAFEKGKGVIVLTAHFGNWELLSVIGAILSLPIAIVYRPLDFAPLDRFIGIFRTRFGATLIPKRKSVRGMLKNLRQGNLILLLMDQNTTRSEGVFVDFFGRSACTNRGMAMLAMRTEAPVVPVFMIRKSDGSHTGVFLPEIPLIKTGDIDADVTENTKLYNQVIESMIRQYPDHWFWVHQRWKTREYEDIGHHHNV